LVFTTFNYYYHGRCSNTGLKKQDTKGKIESKESKLEKCYMIANNYCGILCNRSYRNNVYGRRQRGQRRVPFWIFIHDTDKV